MFSETSNIANGAFFGIDSQAITCHRNLNKIGRSESYTPRELQALDFVLKAFASLLLLLLQKKVVKKFAFKK